MTLGIKIPRKTEVYLRPRGIKKENNFILAISIDNC